MDIVAAIMGQVKLPDYRTIIAISCVNRAAAGALLPVQFRNIHNITCVSGSMTSADHAQLSAAGPMHGIIIITDMTRDYRVSLLGAGPPRDRGPGRTILNYYYGELTLMEWSDGNHYHWVKRVGNEYIDFDYPHWADRPLSISILSSGDYFMYCHTYWDVQLIDWNSPANIADDMFETVTPYAAEIRRVIAAESYKPGND